MLSNTKEWIYNDVDSCFASGLSKAQVIQEVILRAANFQYGFDCSILSDDIIQEIHEIIEKQASLYGVKTYPKFSLDF